MSAAGGGPVTVAGPGPLAESLRLTGVVIVTGASTMRGIGRAVALCAAELGADIVASDIQRPPERLGDEPGRGWRGLPSLAEEVAARGRQCHVVDCDLTRRDEIAALVDTAAAMGPITGLVNAARAYTGDWLTDVVDLTEDEWDATMAVNVRGPMTCSALAARAMIATGSRGSIVNISSVRGSHPLAGKAAYNASKAALEMLTRTMALELGPHGIRVNAVAPGTVATNAVRLGEVEQARQRGMELTDYRRANLARRAEEVPLRRIGEPEDIAATVGFLLSPASSYISGECISVSGGRGAL